MNLNSHSRRNFWNIFKRLSVQRFWVPFLSICMFTFLIWQNFLNFEYCKYFKGMGLLFEKKKFFVSNFVEIGVKWKVATCTVPKAQPLRCNADILENMAKRRKNKKFKKIKIFSFCFKWPYYFSKLKISQNDLLYSIVHFNIFPKWPCNNFSKPCGRCNGR